MNDVLNWHRHVLALTVRLVAAVVALLWALGAAGPVLAQGVIVEQAQEPTALAPVCRFGVNVAETPITVLNVAPLRTGWYIDYKANAAPAHPNGAEYSPVIRLSQVGVDGYTYYPNGAALDAAIAGNPGAFWFIGNEPDRKDFQDDMEPAAYAHAYHDLYALIKGKDPTAQIVAGAIVQPTPVRLKYLDLVLKAYGQRYNEPMPVDAWATHNFILNEMDCEYADNVYCPLHPNECPDGDIRYVCWGADIPPGVNENVGMFIPLDQLQKTGDINLFKEQIRRMRTWMSDRGYANKPLLVSEYGILMPADRGFPPETVNQFMSATFDYMLNTRDAKLGYAPDDNRLVQRFSWYSTSDPGFNGSLFTSIPQPGTNTPPFKISVMGQNFANYTAPIALVDSFELAEFQVTPAAPPATSGPISYTLSVVVANAGNKVTPSQVKVRFFDPGGAQIGATQIVTVQGCGDTAVASVVWPNITPADVAGKKVKAVLYADPANPGSATAETPYTLPASTASLYLPRIIRGIP